MPNWCKNNLRIKGNGEKVLELLELMKDESGQMTFNKLVPMPKELENTTSPAPQDTLEEKAINEERIKRYGAADWYTWACNNWGCKWDASESAFYQRGNDWYISFSTPWGPPMEFMKRVSKQFNKMEFTLQFADEMQSQYPLGEATFINGETYVDGPEEATSQAEEFAEMVWNEEWVDNWAELGKKTGRLKYLREKEETCGLDKEERYELKKLEGGNM